MTDTASVLVNDLIDKVNPTLASSLVTDAVSILTNTALDNNNSTLASSFATDVANIDLSLLLLPFLNTSLSFNVHCITGIDFTYHPLVSSYSNHSAILILYRLSTLITLYSCTLSVVQIRTLVLHTLSFCASSYC